jgi:acetolactate synthase-1/2/3 large subunit
VIGSCLGSGSRRTVLVDGDGSVMPNVQELETIRRLKLPIKILVINNDGYSSIRVSQTRWFQRMIAADSASGLTLPDLGRVAAAFEIPFSRVETESQLGETLDRVLAAAGPALVDVRVPVDEERQPRISNYQKADGSMASKPLEDLFPFLPREEFLANMIIPPIDE